MRFPIVFLCSALCAVSGTGCRSANTAEHSALHPSQRLKDALVSELRSQFASSVVPVEFSSEQVHFSPPGRSVRNGLNLLLADVRPANIRRPHSRSSNYARGMRRDRLAHPTSRRITILRLSVRNR